MPHTETYIDGVYYPSVTTVLGDKPKPWLQKWRDKWGVLAERKTIAANNIGTAFHEGAEGLVWQELVTASTKRIHDMLQKAESWIVQSGFIPVHTERKVISRLYQYSGTLDAIGTLVDPVNPNKKRMLVILDWKTSSGIYPDMALQLAAYVQAYFEQAGTWIEMAVIVHVSKKRPHKLTIKEYKIGKRLVNKFLKRLKEFREYNDPVRRVGA